MLEEFEERLLEHCEQLPTHENISPSGWQNVKKLGKYQFSMDQLLGKGMSGEVYLGANTDSGELVCIKVVDLMTFQSQKQREMLKNQIQCQQMCQSDYILKILDVFDSNSFCFIITEYCPGGDAYKLLKSTPSGLPEPAVWKIAADLAKSLKVLKDARVIHRDIKSENILFGKHSLKLADFGFAISVKQQLSLVGKSAGGRPTNVGSPLYMSPEALESSEYSYGSDVFSFGVVIYEMLHQRSPWECEDEQELKMKIRKEPVVFKPELSQEIKELVSKCLAARLQDRVTIEEILTRVTQT